MVATKNTALTRFSTRIAGAPSASSHSMNSSEVTGYWNLTPCPKNTAW